MHNRRDENKGTDVMGNRVNRVLVMGLAFASLAACAKATKASPAATVTVTQTQSAASAPPTAAASAVPSSSVVFSATPMPHPCSLLTLDEAETLAGTKLNPGIESGSEGAPTLCQYTGDPSGPTAQVEIIIGDGAKKELDIDRDTLGHKFTSVPGIGDEADQEDGNIFVRKGNFWADINLVLLNDPAQDVKPMQTAAAQLAARLP
jgi:hypothetical protein